MEQIYDVVIVGAGPAGLSAAIYMARANYHVLVLEKEKIGGQITITNEVVNYPGVYKTTGTDLTAEMHKQALAFGAKFQTADVTGISHQQPIKTLTTSQGEIKTLGVILALGANPRKLGFQGETEFQGRGVAYCATCDGEFFTGMEVYVIGGGFAAVEEGVFLTKYASHVHIIVRKDQFSCAKSAADHALHHEKITVHFETEVDRVEGESTVNSITLLDKKTGTTRTIKEDNGLGVFVFAGYEPNTSWLPETISLEKGYLVTDINRKTNIDGIYAAGDVCIKELRQVVTAVSDGATAATSLEKYVEQTRKELNLPEYVPEPKDSHTHESSDHDHSHSDVDTSSLNGSFDGHEFITPEMAVQMQPVLERFTNEFILKTSVGTNSLGAELKVFSQETAKLSPKIKLDLQQTTDDFSYMELCYQDGTSSGIRYVTVPGGHEFNSFLLGLFLMAGGGKPVEESNKTKIDQLQETDLKVMISLSCTNCPDVVVACQRIAFENPKVKTSILDIQHNQALKEKYKVMSVPCLVVNDEQVHFGKKSLEQILDLV